MIDKIKEILKYVIGHEYELLNEIKKKCPKGDIEACNTIDIVCEYAQTCRLVKQYYYEYHDKVTPEEAISLVNIIRKLESPVEKQRLTDLILEQICPIDDETECDPAQIQNDAAKDCPYAAVCEMLTSFNLLTDAEKIEYQESRLLIKEARSSEKLKEYNKNFEKIKQEEERISKKNVKDEKKNTQIMYS